MMKIGLIGSGSFYNTYKQEFSKHQYIYIFNECSIDAALHYSTTFENILITCQYLFFEKIDSATFQLVNAGLKNGKHILIDEANLSLPEMHEMYSISNEGNLKCMIFPAADYYKIFETIKGKISNPFLIEMRSSFTSDQQDYLSQGISHTMNVCIQNLLYLFKSDVRHVHVKQSKVFSEKTDLMTVQLDFSNGCAAHIKLSALDSTSSHTIKIYQESAVICINLDDCRMDITEKKNEHLSSSTVAGREINMTEEKVQHFLNITQHSQTQSHSILDYYLAMELTAKIIKKINSLHD